MKVYGNVLALQWAVLVRNDIPTVVRVEMYGIPLMSMGTPREGICIPAVPIAATGSAWAIWAGSASLATRATDATGMPLHAWSR